MSFCKKIIITGGSGFIGSHLIQMALDKNFIVMNLDKLNYCSNSKKYNNKNYYFKKIDLAKELEVNTILKNFKPDAIVNCAAETHVDRSILNPKIFIDSNIASTLNLLNFVKDRKKKIRFIQVSTDEVFGSLKNNNKKFNLKSKYDPKSPYSASKAAADFFVKAFGNTYNIDYSVTNCSNNFGAYQYPEKLIPLIIIKCIQKKKIPIYGKGTNIREWLFVKDHCDAIIKILQKNKVKKTYLIGSNNEKKNIDIVNYICEWFLKNVDKSFDYKKLKTFVKDRKGHDLRYSINYSDTAQNLKWKPRSNFKECLDETIKFYIKNYHQLKKIFPYEKKNNYLW